MTRRRWIADEITGNRAALTGDHARHLVQVLRAQVGQEFDISTGAEVRRGRIAAIRPERVEFELGEAVIQSDQVDIQIRPHGMGNREMHRTWGREDRSSDCGPHRTPSGGIFQKTR
jgi:hypothetical protein